MKICIKCNVDKNISEFSFRNKAKGYLQSVCKSCQKVVYKNYRINNKEKMAERMVEYRSKNSEKLSQYEKPYRKKRYKESSEIRLQALLRRNKRRAREAAATLDGFASEIKEIYKNCPDGYHVDHIMPLKHEMLCGLHVPWNLQYLPAEENLKKGNKVKENNNG